MKIAFVFPGQGSQTVGMGLEFWQDYDEVKDIYAVAQNALGYDAAKLSFEGPKEELDKTFNTQPCLLTSSIAIYTVLTKSGIKPDCVAGHSLGEYSAIAASSVISFHDAVKLVQLRGYLMQQAVKEGEGLMAAVLGAERQKVIDVCRKVNDQVWPANFNCPGQIVISGQTNAVRKAIEMLKQEGVKRVLPLAVSVPSHCPLMEPVSTEIAKTFEKIDFKDPDICFVNNADAKVLKTAQEVKDSLVRQLTYPLLWEDSVNTMIQLGVDTFIEVGPGKVLSGLIRKINSKTKFFNVEDKKSLSQVLEILSP
jgi:[acyl-carrier-protein] S-malonyltransferase